MKPTTRRLAVIWIVGAVVGTAIVAITSPLFVRSYLPLRFDQVRGVWTYPEGQPYRWRSEGYATTTIGPHGMPGRTALPSDSSPTRRVALWGDSQAEGVSVSDHHKLFAQANRIATASQAQITFLPLARSGDDASHWLAQFAAVERHLGIDAHVLVIVDLPDLESAGASSPPLPDRETVLKRSAVAATIPAFLIQSIRFLINDADDNPRRLRFSLGPLERSSSNSVANQAAVNWKRITRSIRDASQRRIVILYAPVAPHVNAGTIVHDDPQSQQFVKMRQAAESEGIHVVDMRRMFQVSASADRWPHGFHNGQIGSGHLNAVGYQLIADQLVPAAAGLTDRKD